MAKSMLPRFVAPELAKLVETPPEGRDWVHEVKFDGYRMQMRVEGGVARLFTRKGLDWTAKFPEIAADGGAMPDCLIDGEICAVGQDRNSDFGALQLALSDGRMGKLIYFVFDCLFAADRDLRGLTLRERKAVLRLVLKHAGRRLRFVPYSTKSGALLLKAACKAGREGIVSKRLAAAYRSGRGGDWTKEKCRPGQKVVIGGWSGNAKTLRSLLVGAFKGGKLVYMGRVGTGYTAATAAMLLDMLTKLARKTAPFAIPPRGADINWVAPRLVAEIEFENVTKDGLFRQAAFKGLRGDKPARNVVPEAAQRARARR
ncbi:MAG: non-homologous end-joining DNA ligase [Proteobacteria bacterium]|nr:non-homologous end-joining DNA ligase [Pseudomonadota bacterium]